MSEDGGNVVQLKPAALGDGAVIEADHILEHNKGRARMLILAGFDQDGEFFLAGTHGSRDALWLIERARIFLMTETP